MVMKRFGSSSLLSSSIKLRRGTAGKKKNNGNSGFAIARSIDKVYF